MTDTEALVKEVWGWLVERGLVDPHDDEWEGFTATIERHENELVGENAHRLVALTAENAALKTERDQIIATSSAYNPTEREGRAIMDEAAAIERAEAAEAENAALREALNKAFDFLGGVDGAAEIRGRILAALSPEGTL